MVRSLFIIWNMFAPEFFILAREDHNSLGQKVRLWNRVPPGPPWSLGFLARSVWEVEVWSLIERPRAPRADPGAVQVFLPRSARSPKAFNAYFSAVFGLEVHFAWYSGFGLSSISNIENFNIKLFHAWSAQTVRDIKVLNTESSIWIWTITWPRASVLPIEIFNTRGSSASSWVSTAAYDSPSSSVGIGFRIQSRHEKHTADALNWKHLFGLSSGIWALQTKSLLRVWYLSER